jgi:hypothetical protein
MAIRIDQIKAYNTRNFSAPRTIYEAKTRGITTAFLSHSHKDKDVVSRLEAFLGYAGMHVYIDWQDDQMPERPNRETAARIKEKIVSTDIFLFLATENSMASRWCPWEIGYADGKKNIDKILVIPTSNGLKTFGNEYIDLYRRVDISQFGKVGIWKPGYSTGAYPMETTF